MNQAIHTLDLVQWFLGPVTQVGSRIGTLALGEYVDVEDTAQLVMDHESGSRSVLFATLANSVDSPVTIEIDTEHARLLIRGDLTVVYADGRTEVVEERRATPDRTGLLGRVPRAARRGLLPDRLDDPNRSGSGRPKGWRRWPSSTRCIGTPAFSSTRIGAPEGRAGTHR